MLSLHDTIKGIKLWQLNKVIYGLITYVDTIALVHRVVQIRGIWCQNLEKNHCFKDIPIRSII